MGDNMRLYLFVGGMFVSLIAGILFSNLLIKFWGHIPYFKYYVLGVSLVCAVLIFVGAALNPDLTLFTFSGFIFLFWMNKAMFKDL